MMLTLVMASQKGGVGKTMLSCALAVEASQRGFSRVALLDLDEQNASTRWAMKREAAGMPGVTMVSGRRSGHLRATVTGLGRDGFDLLVIDTPPAVSRVAADAMAVADLVVVPVQPSPDDVEAVGATIELAERSGARTVFVLNRVKPRVALTRESIIALSQGGPVSPVMIWDRVVHAEARITGRVAGELRPGGKAAEEMAALWLYLSDQFKRKH
jgi:chromosome partitioning protein